MHMPENDQARPKREAIPRKVRFEVFKRDLFTCQYCGRKAPEVVLHLDHIDPVANGGTDDIVNLITSCSGCNLGKGATPLSDNQAIEKTRAQLEELEERRTQLEMMLEWQRSLQELDKSTIESIADFWNELAPGYVLNENGKSTIGKLCDQFSTEEVTTAMRTAAKQYLIYDSEGESTKESWENAFNKISGICRVSAESQDDPNIKQLYYARGIVRKRLENKYYCDWKAIEIIRDAYDAGIFVEDIMRAAKRCTSWTNFQESLLDLYP